VNLFEHDLIEFFPGFPVVDFQLANIGRDVEFIVFMDKLDDIPVYVDRVLRLDDGRCHRDERGETE